jgi:hypothetical protein
MTLREAATVAWHVRVNGMDGVTKEQLTGALAVLEQLAERETLVDSLVFQLGPDVTDRIDFLCESLAGRIRDFKIGSE